MNDIHPSVVVGEETVIGSFTVVMENVSIGNNCQIGCGVIIHEDTIIGDDVRIDDHAVVGKKPMRAANSIFSLEELPAAIISEKTIIGTGSIVYRGCYLDREVLVADLATLRENVKIGRKTIIGRGAAIENFCTVGSNCKLETNVYITAYSILGDYVFVAPGVVTSNDNYAGRSKERFGKFKGITIKDGGRIGAQATVLPGRTIEEDGLAAAGAVVTKDIPAKTIVAGNPAREMKQVPENQLLRNQ